VNGFHSADFKFVRLNAKQDLAVSRQIDQGRKEVGQRGAAKVARIQGQRFVCRKSQGLFAIL
jgi:hypothetical protein